ncbi:MAG: M48 family metalloprotease [Bacteroidetes bacterium]|nr:M48 family metalloprotease [Bacteroidota bacterium]
MWDGDASRAYALNNKFQGINFDNTPILNKQLEVFYQAKEKISRIAGISPKFVICNDLAPNAFAMNRDGGAVIGVSLGMLNFANGDEDMAAAVIAHEVSHHTLGHRERGQSSQFVLELVTGLLGVLADAAIQSRYNVQNSTIGRDLASVGSNLVSSKFSRDYEREADDNGFKYMVAAGYNPEGGIRLANSFIQKGFSSSSGWFNDTHPGWDERAERFKTMIASSAIQSSKTNIATNSDTTKNETQLLLKGLETETIQNSSTNEMLNDENLDKKKIIIVKNPPPIVTLNAGEILVQEAIQAYEKKDYKKSLALAKKAMDKGNGRAATIYAFHFINGAGVKRDFIRGEKLLLQSVKMKYVLANRFLAEFYYFGDGGEINLSKALHHAVLAAENANDSWSQILVGYLYQNGTGVEPDCNLALQYYELASANGDSDGLYRAGSLNLTGCIGIQSANVSKGISKIKDSAAKGNADAKAFLGYVTVRGGYGISKNTNEGMKLLKEAENAFATSGYLGDIYLWGNGGEKNYDLAMTYLSDAHAKGNVFATANLGYLYQNGLGVKKDINKAINYYENAAQKNSVYASNQLAYFYFKGAKDFDLPLDYNKAIIYMRKGEKQNDARALFYLSVAYMNGLGVPLDFDKGIEYLKKSNDLGDEDANKLFNEFKKKAAR